MNTQIIEKDGRPEWVVVPYDEYMRLLERAEELSDIEVFDSAKRDLEEGRDELIPGEVVDRLLAAESPVKVWRQYRGLTQTDLAVRAGLSQSYVTMIERGERTGSIEALHKIAAALKVDLDDLISES